MKGILLAGGNGTRLWPSTSHINKQLLPVYDKPLIYYPLATLMMAGVTDILIIVNESHLSNFKKLLGDGSDWGIKLEFIVQDKPKGIADALIIAPEKYKNDSCLLVLGDNLLYGMGLGMSLKSTFNGNGALAFGYSVANPSDYGVVVLNSDGTPNKLIEKPKDFISNLAIPGIYFLDNTAFLKAKKLEPSFRNELEITDLLSLYLEEGSLLIKKLERGTVWLDTGSADNLLEAAEFVRLVEKRQGLKIACIEEVAFRENLISLRQLKIIVSKMPNSNYKDYLEQLINEEFH